MKLIELREEFLRIKQKGYLEGFTVQDFYNLKNLQNQIDVSLCAHQEKWNIFFMEIQNLLNELCQRGLFHTFSDNNIAYIKSQAHLLPLVLANDTKRKRKVEINSIYFLCQFHTENTPSLRIKLLQNTGHCFGCGMGFDSISYLKEYEKLKMSSVLQLLSQIYLFDVKKEKTSLHFLVNHYQKSILSEEYISILRESLKMCKSKLQGEEDRRKIENDYQSFFDTIERIRNNEYDENFILDAPRKRIYLA